MEYSRTVGDLIEISPCRCVFSLQAVAERQFKETVSVEVLSTEDFSEEGQHTRLRVERRQDPENTHRDVDEDIIKDALPPEEKRISPATFCRAFPFHVIFDKDMTVIQAG